MPLHPCLDGMASLTPHYKKLLNATDIGRRDLLLAKRFDRLCSLDSHMQLGAVRGENYYKAFAQAVKPAVIPTLITALNTGTCPEVLITLAAGKAAATAAGLGTFGSPQDFLYGFTSERYPNWSKALAGMGFRSAVMVGSQQALLTMAPRDLGLGSPEKEIDELSGAIAKDYWETGRLTGSTPALNELLEGLWKKFPLAAYSLATNSGDIDANLATINTGLGSVGGVQGYDSMLAGLAQSALSEIGAKSSPALRSRAYMTAMKGRPSRPNDGQEQIVLKYVQEANLLQKLLGGLRVDHIQSNVKMQKNPARGSSCEVDSIYRVLGEKAVVLVEAKAGSAISRSQLYQIYETFRLKLPSDWKVQVVTALMSKRHSDMPATVHTVIDMAEILFEDSLLGKVTESLSAITIGKHYRWLIHQD